MSNSAEGLSPDPAERDHHRMQVLERDDFLATLVGYADEARSGTSRIVFLAGEAGVGKSTLIELLRQQLPDADWVTGACDGSFTPEPLGPLYDAAPQLGGALARACADDAPRERMFRTLLEQLSTAAFTVFVIEDAHWADEATLDLVRFLGRRLRDSPTLLLVTYRDDGLASGSALRLTLGDLAGERSLRRMTLPALSRSAVRQLASGSGVPADQLYALTGGNPFFVGAVLGAQLPTLPVSARDAVLARVARLGPPAVVTLHAAALLTHAPAGVLRDVAGSGGADGLQDCLDTGLLVSEPDGIRFRHELARLAVEESVPAHQLRSLHARALSVLADTAGVELAQLAHHAEGAADRDAVLAYAIPAAHRAIQLSAHREAVSQLSRSLRFAAELPVAQQAELHDLLATELLLVEQWRESETARSRAVELWRAAGNDVRLGASLAQQARERMRRYEPADDLLAESLALLEPLPPTVELAWTLTHQAAGLMYSDPPAAIELTQRARAVLDASGVHSAALLSDSLNTEAVARGARNEPSAPLMRQALDVAVAGGCDVEAGRGYANVVATLCNTMQLREAARVCAEGIPYLEDRDLSTYVFCLRAGQAQLLDQLGRWDEALAACTLLLDNARLSPFNRSGPLLIAGAIHARRGNRAVAAPLLAEATVVMNEMGCHEDDLRRVELAWLDQDHDRARERARQLAGVPELPSELAGELAVWLRRLGIDPRPYQLRVDEIRSRQLAEPWPDVARMWEEIGAPYEQALTLYDSRDESAMRQAVSLLDRLGATAAIAVVRNEMRRLGFGSIPRGSWSATRSDRLRLTPRQRDVFELLQEGLTNAEIGGRLFLSERTVDHHVAAVLAKLGVTSRHAAAQVTTSRAGQEPSR